MVKISKTLNRSKEISCDGKKRHETAFKANKHRINLLKRFNKKGYEVYKCAYCDGYHVGRINSIYYKKTKKERSNENR